MNKEITVKIRPSFVLWAIGIIAGIALAIAVSDVIVIFFFAFIASAGFRPIVDRFKEMGLPRMLSLILIYIIGSLMVVLILLLTIDTFVTQFNAINKNLPNIAENILEGINNIAPEEWGLLTDEKIQETVDSIKDSTLVDAENLDQIFNFIGSNLDSISGTGLNIISGVTNFVFSAFIVLMLAGYLIARPEKAYRGLAIYIPHKNQEKIMNMLDEVEKQLGEWLIGQLILMLVIGVVTYIAIMIPHFLGIQGYELHQFALLIAVIAGILEAFPNIGPTITLILTALLSLGTGGSFGIVLYICLVFLAIQQAEGVFIVPMVMKRAVDLDPIIVILAISAGFSLGSVMGAILSIPITVIAKIVINELNETRLKHEIEEENKKSVVEQTVEVERDVVSGIKNRVSSVWKKFF